MVLYTFIQLNNLKFESALYPSSSNKNNRPTSNRDTTEDLQMQEVPMIARKEGSPDRISCQPSYRDTKEDGAVADTNLSNR